MVVGTREDSFHETVIAYSLLAACSKVWLKTMAHVSIHMETPGRENYCSFFLARYSYRGIQEITPIIIATSMDIITMPILLK